MTAYRYAVIGCKLNQNANEGCNRCATNCASLAGLVSCLIACFILLVIAPLAVVSSHGKYATDASKVTRFEVNATTNTIYYLFKTCA